MITPTKIDADKNRLAATNSEPDTADAEHEQLRGEQCCTTTTTNSSMPTHAAAAEKTNEQSENEERDEVVGRDAASDEAGSPAQTSSEREQAAEAEAEFCQMSPKSSQTTLSQSLAPVVGVGPAAAGVVAASTSVAGADDGDRSPPSSSTTASTTRTPSPYQRKSHQQQQHQKRRAQQQNHTFVCPRFVAQHTQHQRSPRLFTQTPSPRRGALTAATGKSSSTTPPVFGASLPTLRKRSHTATAATTQTAAAAALFAAAQHHRRPHSSTAVRIGRAAAVARAAAAAAAQQQQTTTTTSRKQWRARGATTPTTPVSLEGRQNNESVGDRSNLEGGGAATREQLLLQPQQHQNIDESRGGGGEDVAAHEESHRQQQHEAARNNERPIGGPPPPAYTTTMLPVPRSKSPNVNMATAHHQQQHHLLSHHQRSHLPHLFGRSLTVAAPTPRSRHSPAPPFAYPQHFFSQHNTNASPSRAMPPPLPHSISAYQSQQDLAVVHLPHGVGAATAAGATGGVGARLLSNAGSVAAGVAGSTAFMNQAEFDSRFQFIPPAPLSAHIGRRMRRLFHCCTGFKHFLHFLTSFLPIIDWLPNYAWRDHFTGDLMAGLTIGVVHVPQGIAYAILTGVDPVFGLYSCFFAVLLYMLFGTSQHVSIGTMAIVSLMTATSCRETLEQLDRDHMAAEIRVLEAAEHSGSVHNLADLATFATSKNMTELVPRLVVTQNDLVQAITLTAGLIQILMAILRVEFLASYLSDQLVNAFCTSAAVHVIVAQLGQLGQIPTNKHSGPGYLILVLRDIVWNRARANWVSMGLSFIGFLFLWVGKEVLGPKMRKHVTMPVPFELLLMVLATVVSTVGHFHTEHGVSIVNKELYAMGITASLSSFFGTYPVCSALGRSMLSVECGAKTQFSSVFAALVLLIVILFFGPLLAQLPMCVLAVLIIYSLKNVLMKMPREVLHLWRVSRIDFMIWIVTFVATLLLNVMQGLAVSVTFALLTTVFRIQWPHWYILSNLTGSDYYRDSGRYRKVTPLGHSIRIFRFDAPLLFTNVEHFRRSIFKALTGSSTGELTSPRHNQPLRQQKQLPADKQTQQQSRRNGPFQLKQRLTASTLTADAKDMENGDVAKIAASAAACAPEKGRLTQKQSMATTIVSTTTTATTVPLLHPHHHHHQQQHPLPSQEVQTFIIDCTGFTFVDYTSVNALADLFHQLTDAGIDVFFAHAKAPIRDMLEQCDFFKSVPKVYFFPTIHDAVMAASNKRRWYRRKRGVSEQSLKRSSSALNNEDAESLCVGEREFFLSSFKNLANEQNVIHEERDDFDDEEQHQLNNDNDVGDVRPSTVTEIVRLMTAVEGGEEEEENIVRPPDLQVDVYKNDDEEGEDDGQMTLVASSTTSLRQRAPLEQRRASSAIPDVGGGSEQKKPDEEKGEEN